jgi:predicted lactoylglutathione lyase
MTGIVFYRTEQLDAVVDFYETAVGMDSWVEQPDCMILERDGFKLGFCAREETDDGSIVTFVSETREGVDEMYNRLQDQAHDEPAENETYEIYHFFATDPDGRTVECQTFLHETP